MSTANAEQHVRVFVGNVPQALREDEISLVFKEYGNIIELRMARDKHTGQAKGYAFVKYTTMEEAQNCITALNGVVAFPDHSDKFINVRLANSAGPKSDPHLYVGKLPISTTSDEIRDIFSVYGTITDINVKRRSNDRSRGSNGTSNSADSVHPPFAFAFVKFTSHSAAEAAIRGLNAKQFITGATGPLRVAYAESSQPSHNRSQKATRVATAAPAAPAAPIVPDLSTLSMNSSVPHVHPPRTAAPSMYMHHQPPMTYDYYSPVLPPHDQFLPNMMFPPMGPVAPMVPMPQHPTLHHQRPQFVPQPPAMLPEPRLHVGSLPNSATREQLVDIFSMYGHVMECHVMRPKGGSSSCCSAFVRFATREQADITVRASNGCLFPGTVRPMVVKYASSTSLFPENTISADHPGSKLFVGGVPPGAAEDDVTSVFSLFGTVMDVFLMRHVDGSSKGSAFVKYATHDMAERALLSVNGIVTMQGGRRALHVKFAGRSSSSSNGKSVPASPAADTSPQHSPAFYTPSPSPSPMPSIPTPPGSPLDSPVSMTNSTATTLMDDAQRGQKHAIERESDEMELPTKLFVGGIPYTVTETELSRFFAMYGVPRDVFIMKNENLQSKGCAFVRMSTQAESERAIRAIDKMVTLPGASRPLRVQFAENDDFSAKRQRR